MRFRPVLALLLTAAFLAGCSDGETAHEPSDASWETYALTSAECLDAASNRRVTFCHATSSTTNPYTLITVSTNACINAHVNHGGDVLPDANGDCCPLDERDCAGVCSGTAEEVDVVHFTTDDGVYRWTSGAPASAPTQISNFPSYALAVSPLDEVFVGTGGLEAATQGLGTPGVYAIDGAGQATLVSATAAEDLQFAPDGSLHAANELGIFAIDELSGQATQLSSDPTSQFAFESMSSVVTTNGTAYAGTFGRGTDRIDLGTGSATLLNGDGGEDIKVDDGDVLLCGQGGLFELLPSGAFSQIYSGKTFNFGVGALGDVYVGNSASYAGLPWPQGLYAPSLSPTALYTPDINALVVTDGCE